MVNRNLLRQFDVNDTDQQELEDVEQVFQQYILEPEKQLFEVNKIVTGRVLNVVGDEVWIDVGYKSEGIIPLAEWYDEGIDAIKPPQPGDTIQVLLDAVED